MMVTKPRKPLSERLKLGLQEALAHAKGELKLKTVVVTEVPAADHDGSESPSDPSPASSTSAS